MNNRYWITVGVTALDGWVSVWRKDNGEFWFERCPAILLQEAEDVDGSRITRAIFAFDEGVGELDPIDETSPSYKRTVHESELPRLLDALLQSADSAVAQ
jgi:hypothetical protein